MDFSTAFRSTVIVVCVLGATIGAAEEKVGPPDENRVQRWAELLPETPQGVGPTVEDRRAWEAAAAAPKFRDIVKQAEQLLPQPIPALPDDLYLDYSRTGNRERCERILNEHHNRLCRLVMAECLENRRRFLPAIDAAVRAICGEKTWVLPAHDYGQLNFRGMAVTLDLRSTAVSWDLATARYWLGERLSPEIRKLIRDELERRTFTPLSKTVRDEGLRGLWRAWWLSATNNWNAVCLAGVTGAALAAVESRRERAWFAAAAEEYVQNYLRGFTPDGYCPEGVGYWNYGFDYYMMLAQTLKAASGGKVDLMDSPRVEKIARFGRRMEILPGLYPAFADCDLGERPFPALMAFLSRRYGWGLRDIETEGLGLARGASDQLFDVGVHDFLNAASKLPPAAPKAEGTPLRDWFPDAGVLICRPRPESRHALGAAMKGGQNNSWSHNHNDVGSLVVALGRETPLADPGREVYTARTFSPRRFESNVLNSFGHSVPRVAGQLQETNQPVPTRVLKAEFSGQADTLTLDLSSAYRVKGLKKLERTFVFSRQGDGKLTVTDEAEFDGPRTFGTALVTFGPWKRLAPDRLCVGSEPDAVLVQIDAGGGQFQVTPEQIREELPGGRMPTRLGIDLAGPLERARLTLTITPLPLAAREP